VNRSRRPLVVISGAASGNGRSLAVRLAAQDCPVAIADINGEERATTASSISGPGLSRRLDVADADAQRAFAQDVHAWAPTTTAAVFNTAAVAVGSSVLEPVVEDDDWLWNNNVHGVVNDTPALLPLLVEQNSGAIVNTSNVFGIVGMPTLSAYCAWHFAVRGFTDVLRHELRGTGVTAIAVHRGGIKTNIVRNARFRKDHQGWERSHAQLNSQFAANAMTEPVKAAGIVQRGVKRGKARNFFGPTAYVIDALARITPSHYYGLLAARERRQRSRRSHSASL
jgi:NADP-dependent 3-hydroxy acid dehydrogenase YdfG